MMVGILALPLEIWYFGAWTALLKNGPSLLGALVVGFAGGSSDPYPLKSKPPCHCAHLAELV
ncbi:MAG: hypothetical protein JW863_14295 [Chitinispirillaceae bacterium]|nr:hypothetical protein [Chitinispirillaceae bacterium]